MVNTKWIESKEEYISILTKSNKCIDDIFEIDKKRTILGNNEEKIIELKEVNTKFLYKLTNDLYEVAIIGLEKAGKSTFVNSLIGVNLLPEAPSRCTYTSTQLEFGNDEATVEFFSTEEFDKKFRKMLESINYSNYSNLSFKHLELKDFELYIEQSKTKDVKSEEEIKEIINQKNELLKYLNKGSKEFSGEQLKTKEFTEFITNPGKARAVKKIILKSSKLENMKNVIIYDVPGFDSPTLLHEEQTMDKIKNCDAIVLVTDISSKPNLNLHQLEVLLKESDTDGIRIDEKFFVFGNKIDRCNDKNGADICTDALKKDVSKYGIAKKERIFVGSAFAYLKNENNEKDKSIESMIQFGLEKNINEPKILKENLEEYNKTERFDILKRKINKNIDNIKKTFKDIISENIENKKFQNQYVLHSRYYNKFKNSIENKLNELNYELKQNEESYKKEIVDKLTKIIYSDLSNISNEDIEKLIKTDNTTTQSTLFESINMKLREKLYNNYITKFQNKTVDVISNIADAVNSKIKEAVLSSMELTKNNQYYEEIESELNKFIEKNTSSVAYDKKMLVPLIERFSRGLFDVMILNPLKSSDRIAKFNDYKNDFYSLTIFDSFIPNQPLFTQPLIKLILAQKEKLTLETVTNKITDFAKEIGEIIDIEDIKEWYNLIEKGNVDIDVLINKAKNKYSLVKTNLFRVIDSQLENYFSGINEELFFKSITANSKNPSNNNELINEINKDIENLKKILTTVILKAISLEKPFISIMNKQILTLREVFKEGEDFIAENISKIKHEEFGKIEVEKANYENRQKIIDEINKVLKIMEI